MFAVQLNFLIIVKKKDYYNLLNLCEFVFLRGMDGLQQSKIIIKNNINKYMLHFSSIITVAAVESIISQIILS